MNKYWLLYKILAALALVGMVMSAYWIWARPFQLHWGATDAEVLRPMPGDELDASPTFLATRAITIEGTPQQIWPWLLQMGYGRAGFYGYDILENLGSPRGIQSADRILAQFQQFKVGDIVPISAVAHEIFYAIAPDQYLIWAGTSGNDPGGFTWALYPINEHQTRLVSRIRWSYHSWTQPEAFVLDVFTEFTDHLAVRKILQGVKGRVEDHVEPMIQANTEFAIYVASVLIFLGAVVLILLGPLAWRTWLAGFSAGAAWLITWYAPVSIWVGAFLELFVLWRLCEAFRQSFTRKAGA